MFTDLHFAVIESLSWDTPAQAFGDQSGLSGQISLRWYRATHPHNTYNSQILNSYGYKITDNHTHTHTDQKYPVYICSIHDETQTNHHLKRALSHERDIEGYKLLYTLFPPNTFAQFKHHNTQTKTHTHKPSSPFSSSFAFCNSFFLTPLRLDNNAFLVFILLL